MHKLAETYVQSLISEYNWIYKILVFIRPISKQSFILPNR